MSKGKAGAPTTTVWEPQKAGLENLYSQAGDLLSSQDALNAQQLQAHQMQTQYAGGQPLQDIVGGSQRALQSALDPNTSMDNPYLQKAMQSAIRPLTQNYQENVLSGITDQAVGAGQMGSSRQGIAEGIAARGYMDQVGDITNQMAYQNYGDAMARQQAAIGQAGQVANLGMVPSNIIGQVGAEQQQAPLQQLQNYQSLMGTPITQDMSEREKSTIFGAIGTGVGAYFGGPAGAAVGGSIGSSLDS